jgi:hypothetical protein
MNVYEYSVRSNNDDFRFSRARRRVVALEQIVGEEPVRFQRKLSQRGVTEVTLRETSGVKTRIEESWSGSQNGRRTKTDLFTGWLAE